jgi:hypothetical protein
MPWQTAPSLIIIGGAFNVAAGLMWGAHRLGYGEVRACVRVFLVVVFPLYKINKSYTWRLILVNVSFDRPFKSESVH